MAGSGAFHKETTSHHDRFSMHLSLGLLVLASRATRQPFPYQHMRGRTIAQAVSRRLPTAASRVRSQVRSCGNCGEQSGTGAGFLRVLRFPLPILILLTAPCSLIILSSTLQHHEITSKKNGCTKFTSLQTVITRTFWFFKLV
jgi:hypothetical protein